MLLSGLSIIVRRLFLPLRLSPLQSELSCESETLQSDYILHKLGSSQLGFISFLS